MTREFLFHLRVGWYQYGRHDHDCWLRNHIMDWLGAVSRFWLTVADYI